LLSLSIFARFPVLSSCSGFFRVLKAGRIVGSSSVFHIHFHIYCDNASPQASGIATSKETYSNPIGFDFIDTNHDGFLESAEWDDAFTRLDQNQPLRRSASIPSYFS